MRPSPGGDALPTAQPRSRKSSVADHAAAYSGPAGHVPTTFFMRSEEEMEQSLAASQTQDLPNKQRDSTFGIQSLEDTLEAAFGRSGRTADKTGEHGATMPNQEQTTSPRTSYGSPKPVAKLSDSSRTSPKKSKKGVSGQVMPLPAPPFELEAQSPPSALPSTPKSSSLKSLKLSDEESCLDDAASQALASSGDEEYDGEGADQMASGSSPQLIIPSLQMPSRRPFTAKGQAMGKLKILVAGEAGIGKTSLIRSIVQLCEDIVHVDPLSPSQSFSQSPPPPQSRKRKVSATNTTRITEIHASTKTYPPWWNEVEESRTLRRRKSSSDNVLERNICFVDTPGVSKSSSHAGDMSLVVDFVESLLYQTASLPSLEDSDLLGVVSGRGGVHVDVVLYLLPPHQDITKDIEFMQRLSALTNVVPLIAKSDSLSPADLVAIKTSILARLQTTTIKPFLFGNALEDALLAVQGLSVPASSASSASEDASSTEYPTVPLLETPMHPYAVSSTPGSDSETMDASLLMSSEYVQPLYPSELAALVNQIFEPEAISWLRHSAAKKFLAWRRRTRLPGDSLILHGLQHARQRGSMSSSSVGLHGSGIEASATSSIFSAASPSGVLVPRANSPFYLSNSQFNSNLQSPFPASSPSLSHTQLEALDGPTDFSLARYNSYGHGEQRLSEVRLAKWATDLQKSLRNERDRFEELQRNERAKWLLERVSEEVREGNITTSPTTGSPRADWAMVRHGKSKEASAVPPKYTKSGKLDSRDPLGLCDFSDEVRRRGFVVVKVLGGMSVVGAVFVAVVKACGMETGLPNGGIWSWITGGSAE